MIPIVLGISFILFSIMNLTPGDPATIALGLAASEEELDAWREERGLNDPFFSRYFKMMTSMLHGDFGKSYRTNQMVRDEVFPRVPTTLILATGSALFMILIGIPVGIISAYKQYTIVDNVSMLLALIITSMPAFWLGLLLILVFSLKLDWLPPMGIESARSFILPCITLASAMTASLLRMTRSSMLEVIRQDYIRTARAKGATEKRVIFKHALRNALLPVITVIGLSYGAMFGGAMVTETVFAIPGIGSMLVNSVRMKDTPVVVMCVIIIAVFISLINLVVDVLYTYVDPRLKTQFVKN